MVSTDALLLGIANSVPILLLDGQNRPAGQVWSGQYGSISTIRKQQALWSSQIDALIWVRNNLILPKVEAQLAHLKTLPTRITRAETVLTKIVTQIEQYTLDSWHDKAADTLRGYEGTASRHYFGALALNLPMTMRFDKRSTNPATDAFNAALNYAYGILYGLVEVALLKSGIDPSLGVLHTDRYAQPTFVYDFIEPYRIWADEVLMQLCCTDTLCLTHFETLPDASIRISKEGRRIIVAAFLKHTEGLITIKRVSRQRITHIDLAAARLATLLKTWKK